MTKSENQLLSLFITSLGANVSTFVKKDIFWDQQHVGHY